MDTRLLTVKEVADVLRVSSAWVYQHSNGTRRPAIPSVKIGASVRFRESDVRGFIERQVREAAA